MTRFLLCTVAISICMVSPVFSQDSKPPTPFEITDQNGDGKISHEEYRNRAVVLFFDYDLNGDNILTPDELPEYRNAQGQIVPPNDLTLVDYTTSVSHSFDMGDTDKDGFLSISEWGIAPSMNK